MEFQAPLLPELNMPINIMPYVLNIPVFTILLVIFFIFYVVISGVLMYHWSAYGMKSTGILVAETFYIFVSLVLFAMAGLALYYF